MFHVGTKDYNVFTAHLILSLLHNCALHAWYLLLVNNTQTIEKNNMIECNVKYLFSLVSFLTLCNALVTNKSEKEIAVKEIIQKIYNLTSGLLLNGTSHEKDEILKSIKSKLFKSAEVLGPKAEKYVHLIMRGIQMMAFNNTNTTIKDDKVSNFLRNANRSEPIESATNNDLVKKLASKMFKLAQKQFRRAKTTEEKQKIIENIKQKIMETAKQKHDLLHTKHNEIKTYTDLITRGMELMMDQITHKKRRMIMEFVNTNFPSNRDEENIDREYNQLEQRSNFLENTDAEFDKLETKNERPTEMPRFYPSLTTPFSCEGVLSQACTDIKSLYVYICSDNGITLPLNKLCDGITDCSDGSDERNCVNEATTLLHRATEIMSGIERYLLRKCFLDEDNSLILKQNRVLNDVLQKQISFINKYKDIDLRNKEFGDVYVFKQTLNEAAIVIKTLSIGLGSSLCNRHINKKRVESMSRKFPLELAVPSDELSAPLQNSQRSCKCRGSFCTNITCPEVCKKVCWHKYNLGKWSCQAVDASTAVSLDMVCDGKLDCYDETDESDCNSGTGPTKFEANDIFQKVLKMVYAKIILKDYDAVKNKLLSLQNYIKKLQMESTKSKTDVINIKNARDLCFASLSSVYEGILEKAPRGFDLENAHFFLLSVNEKLLTALKHSHTGNDKIISPDGCFCRNGKCALTQCTRGCHRACSVESKLTKYACKNNVNSNVSVTLEKICNGKADCPFEDDEADCSNEVCRKHHIVLLRHSIRDVGAINKGSLLGEVLRSWKTKVLSTLKIAENSYRPTRKVLREMINDVLHDLVMTYASMSETRRTYGYALNEFLKISQLVIGAIKSCGQ